MALLEGIRTALGKEGPVGKMGWGPEWGDAGGGHCLLPPTSTGGQCNIKVPPDCSVLHNLTEALGFRNLGQLVIFGTPGGQVPGQVSWGLLSHWRIKFVGLFSFWF